MQPALKYIRLLKKSRLLYMHCLLPEEANLKAFSSKKQYYMLYK